jgi:hypothetical protein
MNSILHIEGDPTSWVLPGTEPVEPAWSKSADPVALKVAGPLAGTLLLSPRHAGSIVIVPPPPGGGWVPAEPLASARLYVPSTAGASAESTGYELAAGTNVDELQNSIIAAMQHGDVVTVPVSTISGDGVVLLDGAVLSFAVVCAAG